MTRLRRSARVSEPIVLTREDQYEKLIRRALEPGRLGANLRQFNIPNHIFANLASTRNKSQRESFLEALPSEVLLEIVNMLWGNDQIMLALSCKTMASVVETSPTRKIANIADYKLGFKEFTSSCWPIPGDKERHLWGFRSGNTGSGVYLLVEDQYRNLCRRIGSWLGPKYAKCIMCREYRIKQKKWWSQFAEYESPGIISEASKKERTKVNKVIDDWVKNEGGIGVCPVHALIQERKGKRLLRGKP